jgi:hypothetical protein
MTLHTDPMEWTQEGLAAAGSCDVIARYQAVGQLHERSGEFLLSAHADPASLLTML